MSQIEHLVTLQSPNGGLSKSKAQILYRNTEVYSSTGTKFVYVFSLEKKQITAVYQFPSIVWQLELSVGSHHMYVLCAQNGLYLLELDERGRLLRVPSSAISRGDMTIYQIGSDFGLLLDPSICSFTVTSEVLVVALAQEEKWKIVVLHKETVKYEDLFTGPSRELAFSHGYRMNSGDLQPVLCCVSLWTEKATPTDATCNVALKAALFTKLFGVDCAMLKSSMVLCGFPDGQVVSFPMKNAGMSTKQGSFKLLYHLEQPVVSVGAIKMGPRDSNTGPPPVENSAFDCLLVVGQKGLIVSVTEAENPDAVSCAYNDYRLPAPVSCTFFSMAGVFCSTSSHLIYVTVPRLEKKAAASTTSGTISSLRHNIPMIAAVSQVSSLDDPQLVALSTRGHLILCKLNQKGTKDQQHGLSSANAGQRIKELLSGIGSVSERVTKLKAVTDEKSRSLARLNQVMSLSREVLSGQSCPLKCAVRVSWSLMLQRAYMTASCSLENRSAYMLEDGWTLCLLTSTDPVTSYSFPVLMLKPGETKEFIFPLCEQETNNVDFPIKMSCSLFYNLKGFAADHINPSEPPMSSSYRDGVCLPLQEQIIDILQCLRLGPSAAHCSGSSCTLLEDTVQAICKTSSGSDQQGTPPAVLSNQGPNYTMPIRASVRLSVALLTRLLKNEKSGRSLCSAVLHWLLSEVLVKGQEVHEVQGLTPDGKEFCIRVQEVSVTDLSSAGSIQAVEVQILSSYLHAVASLHLAALSRFQILLQQDKPNNEDPSPDLNLGKIQQLFSAREPLLKEVKTLRERLGVDEDLISSAAAQKLLHIYRDLRDPGLLFI